MSPVEGWPRHWPAALAAWSAQTLLRDPRFLDTDGDLKAHRMYGQLAAIRLRDSLVMVNTREIRRRGLEEDGLAILAHEIGHHVYVPGNLTDHARLIISIDRILVGLPRSTSHMVANLYADLLINDRLQRRAGIDIARVYRKLRDSDDGEPAGATWQLYTRTYEHLWRLGPGSLTPGTVSPEMDGHAMLTAQLIRTFARDWVRGGRRFAAIFHRYLAEDHAAARPDGFTRRGLHDTRDALPGDAVPDGLTEVDPSELGDGDDVDLTGLDEAPTGEGKGSPGRQCRRPCEYEKVLESLGSKLPTADIVARYYRERALPHLLPFPVRRAARVMEPLAEGWEPWGVGDALDELDLTGSVMASPIVVPGVTTVRRVYGETPGTEPARVPMDLDIYVDCSGSMPDPAIDVSYLALCATILSLSALRAGARVQATLWSSPGVFATTGGFIRDEKAVVAMVSGYVSGDTAFPIHLLRDTYEGRAPSDRAVHLVVISDDGCDTMLNTDERGNEGTAVASMALHKARGGGTLVLNLPHVGSWPASRAFTGLGFRIHAVSNWEDLVIFARRFVRDIYGTAS